MKASYHICFTSHGEAMFRDREDHGMFINLMALRAFSSETLLYADAEMSNHIHLNVFTSDPAAFGAALRASYTKYFNRKYGRRGKFGEAGLFIMPVRGINHQIVLLNYILRNGLHHGASASAQGYEWCSVREPFAAELGWTAPRDVIRDRGIMESYLPRHSSFPDSFIMDGNGVFLRSSFMEIRQVEQFYVSPRNYLFQMNRLTDASWEKEQEKDNTGKSIRLNDVEAGFGEQDIAAMLKNESGRHFRPDRMQDLDVCRLIDTRLLGKYGLTSVYQLNPTQRQEIFRLLYYEYRLPESQIRRCLVVPPEH